MPADGLQGHFGPLEYAVLEVVWARHELDVQDCVTALGPSNAYSTIKTVMERLTVKGLLARTKRGRSYVYRPVRSREAVEEELAHRSARALLDGYGRLGVTGFVDAVRRDPDSVSRLRALLDAVPADQDPATSDVSS